MKFQKSIDSILDTPNVEGLIVFDLDGSIHFEQTPEYTDPAMLEKLPHRILVMYDIIAENFQNCSDFILKFEQKNLYFRKSQKNSEDGSQNGKDFILAIVCGAGVNFVSLKLVTNLTIKVMEIDDQVNSSKKSRSGLTYRGQKL